MLTKTMTYKDFNGGTRTEKLYFNLTQAEVMELELTTQGGLAETIDKIISAKNTPEIVKLFKKVILMAYGEKSPDGKYFRKSEEISAAFASTNAYSDLFMLLSTDDKEAAAFVNGIMPETEGLSKADQKAIIDEKVKEYAEGIIAETNQ